MTDNYCTIDDVIVYTQVTPKKLGIDINKTPDRFNEVITGWIIQATDLINQYTNNPVKTGADVPPTYCNVCTRIVAHMVITAQHYKNNSLIKVNDWTLRTVPSEIFTQAEKDDLEPYILENSTRRRQRIQFTAVTGRNTRIKPDTSDSNGDG